MHATFEEQTELNTYPVLCCTVFTQAPKCPECYFTDHHNYGHRDSKNCFRIFIIE